MSIQKRLYKNKQYAKIGGVCQGLGEYFDIDPTIIRVLWVIAALFYGTGLLIYFVMWAILPEKNEVMNNNVDNPEYKIYDDKDTTNTTNTTNTNNTTNTTNENKEN